MDLIKTRLIESVFAGGGEMGRSDSTGRQRFWTRC